MLRVSNLSISYKKINAVRNISFEIGDGEIVSLIGSNGAGKTSTMRAISGLVRTKSGSVILDGEEMTGKSPSQIVSAGIVHVPEGRQVFSRLTVAENLEMGGYSRQPQEIPAVIPSENLIVYLPAPDTIYSDKLLIYDDSRPRLSDLASEWIEDTPIAKFFRHNLATRKTILTVASNQ